MGSSKEIISSRYNNSIRDWAHRGKSDENPSWNWNVFSQDNQSIKYLQQNEMLLYEWEGII